MKKPGRKNIGASLESVAAMHPATTQTLGRRLFDEPTRAISGLMAKGERLGHRLAVLVSMLAIALVAPVMAQTQAGAPADQRAVVLRQLGNDGRETIEKQTLEKGQGLLVTRLNGKIVSKEVVQTDGAQRIIIKFKDQSLARRFSQGLRMSDAQAAQRQMDRSREGFRGRLLALENQHRASKGMAAVTPQALIAREYFYCFNGLAAHVHRDLMEEIQNMPEVERVYLDQRRSKCDGYGIGQIGAPQVWQQVGVTGKGIKIAILDSGIDYLHPDLGGGIGPGFKVLGGFDFVNSDSDPMDDNGHGTHVAGIAAANGQIKGVAPDASLLAVKVLNMWGDGVDSDIISGIEWAVTNGANIINLSLGGIGDPDDPLSQAVDQATQAGVLVVAAAGNIGGYNTIGSPAAARTAIAVGADDSGEQMAFFSSRGPAPSTYQIKPEVVAPGVGIYSTVPSGGCMYSDPSGYLILDGTSMASPHVAGAAALLLEEHPQWTPRQLKLVLMERAVDLNQDVMTQGSGQVDVFASATSPISSTGGELSLGWDDLRQSTFTSSQSLTVTNTSNAATQVSLTTRGNVPAGMQVTVVPSSLSLQPGEGATVSFTLNVNNATTPNLPATPFTYSGSVVATSASGVSIHRPFAFCKAPKLSVTSDQLVDFMAIFHGSDAPQFQGLFSQGPFEMLMPAGTYDFYFDLSGPLVPHLMSIVREKVAVSSLTSLSLSKAEAKNKLQIKAINCQGSPLAPDFNDLKSCFLHRASNFSLVNEVAGYPIDDSDYCYVSNVSSAFTWNAAMAGLPNDSTAPMYVFSASLDKGITHSEAFTFKPKDLNKTILRHAARPDNSSLTLYNWFWLVDSWGWDGSGYQGSSAPVPFEQTVYSVPPGNSDAAGGYWSVDGIGEFYSGNLPFWSTDALYKTPLFRPIGSKVLGAYDTLGEEISRTGAKRLLLGQGPAYWSGSMQNLPGMIRIQTSTNDLPDQKLFNGGGQEELVHGLLPYTLCQNGTVVASGTLDQAMMYIPGMLSEYVVTMDVAPGAYELVIPFTGFYLHDKPGQLEVRNQFDTTRKDPNPPYLTSYQLINPLDLLQQYPFLDAIPITGAELRFGADDDVMVKEARLFFQHGNLWLPLPLLKVDQKHYAAYVPGLGGNSDGVNLKLVVTDTSGNALTLTESIPYARK